MLLTLFELHRITIWHAQNHHLTCMELITCISNGHSMQPMKLRLMKYLSPSSIKKGILQFLKEFHCLSQELNLWPIALDLTLKQLRNQCLLEEKGLFRQYVYAAALRTTFCRKIAGLRPAIFSGTPRNIKAIYLALIHLKHWSRAYWR